MALKKGAKTGGGETKKSKRVAKTGEKQKKGGFKLFPKGVSLFCFFGSERPSKRPSLGSAA